MRPELHVHMRRQCGLITRPQAMMAGLAPREIDRLVRNRQWVAVRRGVYAEAAVVEAATTWRQRRMILDLAASLRVSSAHVLSHDSAAYVLDMPILRPAVPLAHLTRPGLVGRHVRVHDGIKQHLAPHRDDQVQTVLGRRVLDVARTAADVAREHGRLSGLVAMDSARRAGARAADLWKAADAMTNWAGVTTVRRSISDSDPDTDSIGETLSRDFTGELGHGRPQTQFGLTAGTRTAWCDLRLDRHIIEFDGKIKYHRVEDGGVADDEPEDVVWREKQRQDWVCGFKLGMSRLVWTDFFGPRRVEALAQVEREYLDTCHRFGTDISDLAEFRPRTARPRRRPRTNLAA